MRRSFFGYNVKEVDEALGQLTSQNASLIEHNDFMEEELKNLKQQLAEAKAAVADGMTKAELDNYKELKAAYAALRENVNASGENNRKALQESEEARRKLEEARQKSDSTVNELRLRLTEASAQITELQTKLATAINERDNIQGVNIGSFNRILENACREIALAKNDTRQEMDTAIETFNTQWSDAQAEMSEHARKITEINAGVRQKYEEMEKMIQDRLAELDAGDTDINKRLATLETERKNLSAALSNITSRLGEK